MGWACHDSLQRTSVGKRLPIWDLKPTRRATSSGPHLSPAFASRRIGNFTVSARVSWDVGSAQRNLKPERLGLVDEPVENLTVERSPRRSPRPGSHRSLSWPRPVRWLRQAKLGFVGVSVIFAATACGSVAAQPSYAAPPYGPLVQQLASEVNDARAMEHLQALQQIADKHGGNRAAGTSGYDASVKYVVEALRDAGFKASTPTFDASDEDGESSSRPQRNVIAQTRTGDPGKVVMIGAHLDSVEEGPGIVDNGSGVATLLEIATQLGADPSVQNTGEVRVLRRRGERRPGFERLPARAYPRTIAKRSSCI